MAKLDTNLFLESAAIIGGSETDAVSFSNCIDLDAYGSIYITGRNNSSDFPTTSNAYDAELNSPSSKTPRGKKERKITPSYDAFISKFSSDLDLKYSSFLGGSDNDFGNSIKVVEPDNFFISGNTVSSDFPLTGEPISFYKGSSDVFVVHMELNNNDPANQLTASTLIGGSGSDSDYALTANSTYVYITGETTSNDFPTLNAFQERFNIKGKGRGRGGYDVFVSVLDLSLSTLVYSTYISTPDYEAGTSIEVDSQGYIYITGLTNCSAYPSTDGSSLHGDVDVILTVLNPKTQSPEEQLVYSTIFGGSGPDRGSHLAIKEFNSSVFVYISGITNSSDIITHDGSYNHGGDDVFLAIFKLQFP